MSKMEKVKLYRECMRVYQRWPVEEMRPGRSLRDYLKSYFPAYFRSQQGLFSADHVRTQLSALDALLNNQALSKYPKPDTFQPLNRDHYHLISTEAQKTLPKLKARDFVWDTVMGWIDSAVSLPKKLIGKR